MTISKKWFVFALLALILTTAACGGKEVAATDPPSDTTATTTAPNPGEEDPTPATPADSETANDTVTANGKAVRKEGVPNIVTNFSEQEWKQYGANLRQIAKEETRFDDFVDEDGLLNMVAYLKANDFVVQNWEKANYKTREDGTVKFVDWDFFYKNYTSGSIRFSRGYKKTGELGEFGYRINYFREEEIYLGKANTRIFENKGVSPELAIQGFEYAHNMENLSIIVYNAKHDEGGECLFAHCGIEHTLSPRAFSTKTKTEKTTEFFSKEVFPDYRYIIDNETNIHTGCEH